MNIYLDSLELVNFKGIKNLTVNFGKNTDIKGDNATGKTTINDGFRWCLFGKDSEGNSDFGIKTVTEDGQEIHNLEHEVTASLLVDDAPVSFKRSLKEKWVKPRGQNVPVMQGHETTYFFNDCPISQREYMAKIDAICPETHFKLLTDPLYFPSLPWAKQRELLGGLAGGISDMDVAKGNPVFIALLDFIKTNNITLVEYKKQLAAKRLKVKEQLDAIPTRIDEAFRGIPEARDWAAIQLAIDEKEKAIKEIDDFIAGKVSEQSKAFAAIQLVQDKKNDKITLRDALAFEIRTEANKVINDAKDALATIKFNISNTESGKNRHLALISVHEKDIVAHKATLDTLREEWRNINLQTLAFKEHDFCCPTCAREYDAEKYETIQATMTATFNENKALKLAANVTTGTEIAGKVKELERVIKANQDMIAVLDQTLLGLKELQIKAEEAIPAGQPDIAKLLKENTTYQQILKEIEEIQVPAVDGVDFTDREKEKAALRTQIDLLKKDLSDKEAIEKANQRIEELKASQTKLAQEQATIEAGEFEITNFEKTKIETVEAKVNRMFKVVKFKMFEAQINGGETPTCVATVNGVSFPDLNNAMKINAGMDIINTLSKANNVYAPVFIDNRESVNVLAECHSQIVNLIVTKTPLTIN